MIFIGVHMLTSAPKPVHEYQTEHLTRMQSTHTACR